MIPRGKEEGMVRWLVVGIDAYIVVDIHVCSFGNVQPFTCVSTRSNRVYKVARRPVARAVNCLLRIMGGSDGR